MGRLLKKKNTIKKKKKNEESEAQADNTAPEKSAGASKEIVKKQASPQKKTSVAAKTSSKDKEGGSAGKVGELIGRGMRFLREANAERKKVTWPSRKQTIGSTVVVLILVFIISFFLGAVDVILSALIKIVLQS